jgi:hypothetical protein
MRTTHLILVRVCELHSLGLPVATPVSHIPAQSTQKVLPCPPQAASPIVDSKVGPILHLLITLTLIASQMLDAKTHTRAGNLRLKILRTH